MHCPQQTKRRTPHAISVYARSTIHNEITDSFYEDETRHRDSQSSYSYKQPYASRGRNILNEHMIPKGSSVAVRRAGGSTGAALRSRSAVRRIFEKLADNFRFFHKNYREIDADVGERVWYVSWNFIAFEQKSMVLARATDVKQQLSRPSMIRPNADQCKCMFTIADNLYVFGNHNGLLNINIIFIEFMGFECVYVVRSWLRYRNTF